MIKVLLWLRNVTASTRQGGQTTIPYPAVTVLPAPEMIAAPVADVLVHRSRAFHVKNVTMMHVA